METTTVGEGVGEKKPKGEQESPRKLFLHCMICV